MSAVPPGESPVRARTRRRLVVHVITRMILGGAQENTLISALGARAHERWDSVLVTGPSLGPEGALLEIARHQELPVITSPWLRRAIAPLADLVALLHLIWIFVVLRPTVVHTHSSKAGILGRIAARIASVPRVVHTIHGLPFHAHQGRFERWLYTLAERLTARFADRIVGVARAMCDQALAARVGHAGQFLVIHSGMDADEFLAAGASAATRARVRATLGLQREDVAVMLVARLFELKGHDDLLAVAPAIRERIAGLKLVFVGDGIRRDELAARAQALGLFDRVIFTGLVPPGEIPGLLAAADLLVHTSLREGLARVLPQALLTGTPVIAYDIDGAREVIEDQVTGRLIAPGDLAALERACIEMLSDRASAKAMATTGRERCAERFRASLMVSRLIELYDELIGVRHGLTTHQSRHRLQPL